MKLQVNILMCLIENKHRFQFQVKLFNYLCKNKHTLTHMELSNSFIAQIKVLQEYYSNTKNIFVYFTLNKLKPETKPNANINPFFRRVQN